MNTSTRNLRYPAQVSSRTSTRLSLMASAWTPSGDGMASPRRNNKGVKKLKKILRDKKAISTILAALLMVVIVVVASVMVYAWSTGLLGALMGGTPDVGQEVLTLDTATMASTTSFGLNFRNQGTVAVTLTGYYVRDAGGTATFQRLSGWTTGPTIAVNQVGTANVTLTGGTWTGTTFTFQAGYTYRIQVQTASGTLLPEVIVPK